MLQRTSRIARRLGASVAPIMKTQTMAFSRVPVSSIAYRKALDERRGVFRGVQRFDARFMSVVVETLESLGDSISTAVVVSWSKEPGDSVKEDDVIAVVETDKVTMDIRAKKSGVFVEALVAAKGEATVGNAFYKIDTSAQAAVVHAEATVPKTAAPAPTPAATPAPAAAAAKVEDVIVNVPIMGESITQGTVGKWHAKTGDFVKADQVIAEIETDKVNVEVRSPQDGVISKVFAGEGDEVSVANPFFALTPADGSAAPAAAPAAAAAPVVKAEVKKEEVKAAPAAAPAPKKETAAPKEEKKAKPAESAAPVFTGDRSETRVKMTRMRTRIAARLKESQNTAAMLTTFQECDMSNLIDLRNKFKDDFEKVHGVKLGFMSAFVKAASAALQEIPAVNAVIDDETQEVVYRNYVDISVAVASPNGLVVPVLRNTEKMNFADVEKTIALYGKKAKENKLAIEDMAGGTFTISNGGVFGSLFGTPIINPPQSAILGMHATKLRPVVVNGKVEARPMMYLALTYDHRLIDGREAVTFLKSIAQKIEDPSKLLLTL
eukprot:gene10378-11294_t